MDYKYKRRDQKLLKRKGKMKLHGKNTGDQYKDAVLKRARKQKHDRHEIEEISEE